MNWVVRVHYDHGDFLVGPFAGREEAVTWVKGRLSDEVRWLWLAEPIHDPDTTQLPGHPEDIV